MQAHAGGGGELPSVELPRRLASSAPIPIRITPEYQFPPEIAPDDQVMVSKVVSAAIRTLQGYIQVGASVPANKIMHIWY